MRIALGLVLCCLAFLAVAVGVHGQTSWTNGLSSVYMKVGDHIPYASSSAPYFAILQSDGNFCVYPGTYPTQSSGAVWCSGVAPGTGNYFAILQTDGNFCVYTGTGPSNNNGGVWCSMALSSGSNDLTLTLGYCGVLTAEANGITYWRTPADVGAEGTCRPAGSGIAWPNGLAVSQFMRENDYIPFASSTAPYFAIQQSDGNFCVYPGTYPTQTSGAVWCTMAAPGGGNYFAIVQTDGNFCTYKGTGPSDNHGAVWCASNVGLTGSGFTVSLGACGVLTEKSSTVTIWSTPASSC